MRMSADADFKHVGCRSHALSFSHQTEFPINAQVQRPCGRHKIASTHRRAASFIFPIATTNDSLSHGVITHRHRSAFPIKIALSTNRIPEFARMIIILLLSIRTTHVNLPRSSWIKIERDLRSQISIADYINFTFDCGDATIYACSPN